MSVRALRRGSIAASRVVSAPGTVLTIAAAGDDIADQDGNFQNGNPTITLLNFPGSTRRSGYFRFASGVPNLAGKTITSAFLRVQASASATGTLNVELYADDQVSPAAVTGNSQLMARPFTTAMATWNTSGLTAGVRDSPDLSAVIQELVNSYGASITAIGILAYSTSGSNSSFSVYTYENGTGAAELHLTYT